MERQPEPDRLIFSGGGHHDGAWWVALYEWRQALGLCRWLLRGDRAERELTAALEADWQGIEKASPKHLAAARARRREYLSTRLAMAVAANAPVLGSAIGRVGISLKAAPATQPLSLLASKC